MPSRETPGRVGRTHLDPLLIICGRLDATEVVWALTGSLGQALQGVPVDVHDIDLQTDEAGAYRIERSLSEFIVRPVQYSIAARVRSHFGELAIHGVKVEVMGAVQKRLADGSWEPVVDVASHRTRVSVAGRSVPVLSLDYEILAYGVLGRSERVDLLRRHLRDSDGRDR